MKVAPGSLAHYLKLGRRRRADPGVIFETAAPDLTARELARLVEALRAHHPEWAGLPRRRARRPHRRPAR